MAALRSRYLVLLTTTVVDFIPKFWDLRLMALRGTSLILRGSAVTLEVNRDHKVGPWAGFRSPRDTPPIFGMPWASPQFLGCLQEVLEWIPIVNHEASRGECNPSSSSCVVATSSQIYQKSSCRASMMRSAMLSCPIHSLIARIFYATLDLRTMEPWGGGAPCLDPSGYPFCVFIAMKKQQGHEEPKLEWISE